MQAGAMSNQGDPTEDQIDKAVEAILGPRDNSNSDLLRPINEENLRAHLEDQRRLFATAGRAMLKARIQEDQKRLEEGTCP